MVPIDTVTDREHLVTTRAFWPCGTDDRYCRQCGAVALVFDPAVERGRCRDCGELA